MICMVLPSGSIFQSKDGKNLKAVIGNLNIANDFTFDEEKNIIYYVDSCNAVIRAQDYDPETSALCKFSSELLNMLEDSKFDLILIYSVSPLANERIAYDNKDSPDEKPLKGPNGIILDTDGNIWVTGNAEQTLYQINPKYVSNFTQQIAWK